MSDKDTCPQGCNLQGVEIPREYLEKGYYGSWEPEDGPRHYSRMIGVEIPGVYDGVLYWACPDCGARWHRFKDEGWGVDLHEAAAPYVERTAVEVAS